MTQARLSDDQIEQLVGEHIGETEIRTLTPRTVERIALLRSGLNKRQTARALGIDPKSLRQSLAVARRLGVSVEGPAQ